MEEFTMRTDGGIKLKPFKFFDEEGIETLPSYFQELLHDFGNKASFEYYDTLDRENLMEEYESIKDKMTWEEYCGTINEKIEKMQRQYNIAVDMIFKVFEKEIIMLRMGLSGKLLKY